MSDVQKIGSAVMVPRKVWDQMTEHFADQVQANGALFDYCLTRSDQLDGDADLEPSGDELDTGNGEDETFTGFLANRFGGPGCEISDAPEDDDPDHEHDGREEGHN